MSTLLGPPPAPTRRSGSAAPAPSAAQTAWTVALRELTDHITSARFLVIALLVAGLTPLAVYVGASDYAARLGEANRLEAERQEVAAGPAGQRVTGNNAQVFRVVRSPEPLSALVRGVDGAMPSHWEFSPTGIDPGPPAALPQRLADLFGQLDFEFLSRVVLGLLAILLAFDAVAGEKELGTLRAALSQPVARSAFLAGKLLGGAITLLVPLAVAVLVALLSGQLFGLDLIGGGTLTKVLLLSTTTAVYLLCLYALGLLVSALTASQKTSLVVLLVVWVVAVLAVPPMSTLVAQAVSPVPQAQAIATRKNALDAVLRRESEMALGAAYREITGQPGASMDGRRALEFAAEIEQRAAPAILGYVSERRRLLGEIDRDVERRVERQNRVAQAIMAISPAAAFASAATDLAGTGDADRRAWQAAIQRRQETLSQVLFEDPPELVIRNEGPMGAATGVLERRPPPSIDELPAFTSPRRDASAAVQRALPGLGLLTLFTALFVAGAFIAFARYDVR